MGSEIIANIGADFSAMDAARKKDEQAWVAWAAKNKTTIDRLVRSVEMDWNRVDAGIEAHLQKQFNSVASVATTRMGNYALTGFGSLGRSGGSNAGRAGLGGEDTRLSSRAGMIFGQAISNLARSGDVTGSVGYLIEHAALRFRAGFGPVAIAATGYALYEFLRNASDKSRELNENLRKTADTMSSANLGEASGMSKQLDEVFEKQKQVDAFFKSWMQTGSAVWGQAIGVGLGLEKDPRRKGEGGIEAFVREKSDPLNRMERERQFAIEDADRKTREQITVANMRGVVDPKEIETYQLKEKFAVQIEQYERAITAAIAERAGVEDQKELANIAKKLSLLENRKQLTEELRDAELAALERRNKFTTEDARDEWIKVAGSGNNSKTRERELVADIAKLSRDLGGGRYVGTEIETKQTELLKKQKELDNVRENQRQQEISREASMAQARLRSEGITRERDNLRIERDSLEKKRAAESDPEKRKDIDIEIERNRQRSSDVEREARRKTRDLDTDYQRQMILNDRTTPFRKFRAQDFSTQRDIEDYQSESDPMKKLERRNKLAGDIGSLQDMRWSLISKPTISDDMAHIGGGGYSYAGPNSNDALKSIDENIKRLLDALSPKTTSPNSMSLATMSN